MSFFDIASLAILMVILAAVPSASVTLVVTRTVAHGVTGGVAVSLGIVLGDLIFLLLAYAGMTVLAETMGAVFAIIKCLGGAYLIWFGITLIRSRSAKQDIIPPSGSRNWVIGVITGLLLTLGDAKAILFYASILPLIADIENPNTRSILILTCMTVVSVGGVKVLYSLMATQLVERMNNDRMQRSGKTVSGCALIGTGAWLILKA